MQAFREKSCWRQKKQRGKSDSKGAERTEYDTYRFRGKEAVLLAAKGLGIWIGGAYFFYRSYKAFLLMLPLAVIYYQIEKKEAVKKRKEQLSLQFKEAVLSVCVSMQAGYSSENAFVQSRAEMASLFGQDSDIYQEWNLIVKAVESNVALEEALTDFGSRSGVLEIQDFAQVFAIGKRSSGDIHRIIHSTVALIAEKIEVNREIKTVLSAKSLELKIMSMVPFGILTYIGITSPGFFDVLYHNVMGITVMTGCLILYLGAFLLGRRIVTIH